MKTEEEARECRCPFNIAPNCITSRCEAWRFGKGNEGLRQKFTFRGDGSPPVVGPLEKIGYCGRIGTP